MRILVQIWNKTLKLQYKDTKKSYLYKILPLKTKLHHNNFPSLDLATDHMRETSSLIWSNRVAWRWKTNTMAGCSPRFPDRKSPGTVWISWLDMIFPTPLFLVLETYWGNLGKSVLLTFSNARLRCIYFEKIDDYVKY